jgi:hypothetical protein
MSKVQTYLASIWRWGYVLWVCRVAVVSAVAGGVLLAYTVQARDLFADLGVAWWEWLLFFCLVFIWAGIVHQSARRALQNDDWVAAGELGTLDTPLPPPQQIPPLVTTVRDRLQQLFWRPAIVIPRLLSFLVFFFVGFAIWRVYLNLHKAANGIPEAAQAVSLVFWLSAGVVIFFLLYAWRYWKKRQFAFWLAPNGSWNYEPPLLAGTAPLFAAQLGYVRPTPKVPPTITEWLWFVARIVTVVMLAITIFNPYFIADHFPRLFIVPLLFSGGVILLGEIAAWSMRWQTPVLLGIVMVSLAAVWATKNFHDTRWINTAVVQPSKGAGDKKQIFIEDAVNRWKAANSNCTDNCPRPILIAGAGGASRAGFYTATVVGALIDLGHDKEKGKDYGDIRNRIFALSTVSGSSAGAAVIRAAMLDAAERGTPNDPPCKIAGTGSWFGQPFAGPGKSYDPTKSWRDCFQVIMAGDFLSPIFVALAYRDSFPFNIPFTSRPAWADRAVLLEQAMERRYRRFTAEDHIPRSCADRPEPATPGYQGLCRPFGHHPDAAMAGAWVPLFFINGTSVFTGRRIVVSDVTTTSPSASGAPFMPMAYDLNDLRRDYIRLSTAATMSARFPIISPQGVLRGTDGKVLDQIVDGGYFENDGLATVMDVARALQHYNLQPVVVRIVNEPGKPEDPAADRTRPPPAEGGDRSLFDDYFAIARALIAARSGHEDQFAASLTELLRAKDTNRLYDIGVYEFDAPGPNSRASQVPMSPQTNPVCRREVKSAAKMEQVSMSWWMSQPVQAYLDAQLCLPVNWQRLECELREGGRNSGGDCVRTPPARMERP